MENISLPDFSNPPINEVLLSVQFEPLQSLVVPEIGLLWQHYGDKFNHVEQHPPIEPIIERYGVREPRSPFPKLELVSGSSLLPRIWFLSESKSELLQIQQDRFIRNWRKISVDESYPRYENCIRPRFLEDFEDFKGFINDNNLGEIDVNQCEISYINHIYSDDVWQSHSEIGKIFNIWDSVFEERFNFEIQDAKLHFRCILRDDEGVFIGRVHVDAQPAFRANDDKPMFVLTLTARGRPLSNDIDGIMKFMDIGRENIVQIFSDITSDEIHKAWEIND